MKKIIICFLLILIIGISFVLFTLFNKNENSVDLDVISDYLEITIPKDAKIEYKDEHDSWFGEGFTIMKITDDRLSDEIKNSSNWREESDEYTSRISGIKNDMSNTYNEISEIQNFYWLYKHNYRNKDEIKYIEQMENENTKTYSYLVGIYDIDNDILYYYHMDM